MRTKTVIVVVLISLLVTLSHTGAATASDSQANHPVDDIFTGLAPAASEWTIFITDQGLAPPQVVIQAGDTVTWINQSGAPQQLVGGQVETDRPFSVYLPLIFKGDGGSAASSPAVTAAATDNWGEPIAPGESFTQNFNVTGNFPYFVASQPGWNGLILVQLPGADVSTGLTGFEPTVGVVNPRNPSMVAVARGCGILISNDFGQTFPIARNTTLACSGDPSLAFDSQGRLFSTHLSRMGADNELTVTVAQIADTTTPGNGNYTPVAVSADDGTGDDKQWLVADANPHSPYADNLYIVWTRFSATRRIMFSRSTDQGVTWSAPQVISGAGEGFVWPSHIAVGANGDVYVAYHTDTCGGAGGGTIPLLRDGSGGAAFAAGTVPQKNDAFGAGEATVTCNTQGSGDEIPGTDFWLQGTMQPWILPDPARPGHVYVVANDDPNNAYASGDDADVVIARSSNHGVSFTRNRVDHGPGQTFAVMPTAHIDQDGNIAVTWYDNRSGNTNGGTGPNGSNNFLLDLYGTASTDGGETFANDFRINDTAYDPDIGAPCRFGPQPPCQDSGPATQTLRIGEYNGVWTVDGIGYTVWTGNAGGNQTTLFDLFSMLGAYADRLEPNESADFAVVASLGADDTYNEPGLTIHSATDVDFFKVVALHTGKIEVEIEFNELLNPMNVRAYDRYGNVIATGTTNTLQPGSSQARLTIPVVENALYFIEVFNPSAPNAFAPQSVYDLTIVNRPAPVPFGLDMAESSDSGASQTDNLTNDTLPTIQLRVDLNPLSGLTFSPPTDSVPTDDPPGYKVEVYRNGTSAGFATPIIGQDGNFSFTFSAGTPLVEGANLLTARVRIVDQSDDPAVAGIAHRSGSGAESNTLLVTLDTTPPAPPSTPDLLDASDSGDSNTDNVTNVNPPAFQGTGQANTKIRILANGELVGEGMIGTDASDGILGNGLGAWEVTIEPLADGEYVITATTEDLAGNISAPSPPMSPNLVIDSADSGMPQRPTLDLLDTFDTGVSDKDNLTNLTELQFRVSAEPGTTVVIKDGNTVIDTFVMPGLFTIRALVLAEGPHPLSSESTDLAGNRSHQSEELLVTVDTTPPTVSTPDLATSSDTAGVNNDDVTTLQSPAFVGTEETNALIRIFAGDILVGQGVVGSDLTDGIPANGEGSYEVTVEPLDDGVYNISAELQDLAGNVSSQSTALPVTIAHQVLNLSGAGAGVTVNMGTHRVTGFPGYPSAGSVVGIFGIPVVNLDVNGQSLTILGTTVDDLLTFSPTGSEAGIVTRSDTAQILNLSGVSNGFTIDPVAGTDTVMVNGTFSPDAFIATVDTTVTVQVNNLLAVDMPNATTERPGMSSDQGEDTISISVYDTVNATLFVDTGLPATSPPVADLLEVIGISPKPHLQNKPGGPVPGSGSVLVTYPQTTDTTVRIDYQYVETVKLTK